MKTRVTILTIAAAFSVSGFALAADMPTKDVKAAVPAIEQPMAALPVAAPVVEQAKPIVVGNKICPVSGDAIPADQLGKNTVEYKGMVFNLCCPMCKAKFLADAEKFAKLAQDEVAKAAMMNEPAMKAMAPVVEKK